MSYNTDPRTCRDIGITSCCTDDTGNGLCNVHFRDAQNSRCSCNVSCHLRNDCCTDAAFFCVRKCSSSYYSPFNKIIYKQEISWSIQFNFLALLPDFNTCMYTG